MKKILFLVLILSAFVLSGCGPKSKIITQEENRLPEQGGERKMENQKKVLLVVAPFDFQEREYQVPRTALEKAGFQVLVGSKNTTVAKSSAGLQVKIDLQLEEIKIDDFDAVVFIGGTGATVYLTDPIALSLAQEAHQKEKVIGAICIAPSILANAGVLKDKKATVYPTEEGNLREKGAIYTGQPVTVDGKIITANEPSAAEEFGQKIVELLNNN